MPGGKGKQRRVTLPVDWWPHLQDWCCLTWRRESGRDKGFDVYTFLGVSKSTITKARQKEHYQVTEAMVGRITHKLRLGSRQELLAIMRGESVSRSASSEVPSELSLTHQRNHPQGADFCDVQMPTTVPWVLRCRIHTDSPYFRFGFKLLREDGRIFGDGSILSSDNNLVIHVGRNSWDRDHPRRIKRTDLFLTSYRNGLRVADDWDRVLFTCEQEFTTDVVLTVDRSSNARLFVKDREHFRYWCPPTICRRVVILAWGDDDEFSVRVTGLKVGRP